MRRWRSAAARRLRELTGTKTVELAVSEVVRRLTDGLECVPLELAEVWPRVNVKPCRPDPELMVAGELRTLDGGFEIVYASSEPAARQRFTVAHEIGHAVMEHTGPHCPRRGKELERICDMIASELLAANEALRSQARMPIDLAEVRRLSAIFAVSVTAMAIRCSEAFGAYVFQVEDDEIVWWRGRLGLPIRSLRKQLTAKAVELIERGGRDGDCELRMDNGEVRRFHVQGQPTGETRWLFILSDAKPVGLQRPRIVDRTTTTDSY